jgi:hypothetical protein
MKVLFIKDSKERIETLIQKSHLTHATIVCINEAYVDEIHEYAKMNGYSIPKPITFTAFLKKHKVNSYSGFLIDNVDKLLQRMAGLYKVDAVAMAPDVDQGR